MPTVYTYGGGQLAKGTMKKPRKGEMLETPCLCKKMQVGWVNRGQTLKIQMAKFAGSAILQYSTVPL